MRLSGLLDGLSQAQAKREAFFRADGPADSVGEVSKRNQAVLLGLGNKPYGIELMLRLYVLQNLYTLSDEETVAEVIDSRAFSNFCGVDSSN